MKHAPQCEGRYVLVGTQCSLLLLDLVTMKQAIIHREYTGYYGITASDTHIYVGIRNNTKKHVLTKKSNGIILVYDFNFTLIETLKPDFPLHEIHEILWHEGKLYITNTAYDMIAIYDGTIWQQWYPLGKNKGRKQDISHFNSISIYNDILYILAHNFGSSSVHIFSLQTKERIDTIQLGSLAHNMWLDRNDVYVCNSNEGTITSNKGFVKHIAEWPRGIALYKDVNVVGSSALGGHGARHGLHNAHIYVYDKEWNTKGFALLQGESQVYEVFPIAQYTDPEKFFEDSRFTKETILGVSSTTELSQNEELLLNLYSINSLRTGTIYKELKGLQKTINSYTLAGQLSKLKHSIQKKLHAIGIGKR